MHHFSMVITSRETATAGSNVFSNLVPFQRPLKWMQQEWDSCCYFVSNQVLQRQGHNPFLSLVLKKPKTNEQTKHAQKPTKQAKKNPFSCVNIVWVSITLISYLKPTLAVVGNCYCVLYLELLCGAHTVIKIFKIVFGSGKTRNEIHSIAINGSWTSNSWEIPHLHMLLDSQTAWLSLAGKKLQLQYVSSFFWN